MDNYVRFFSFFLLIVAQRKEAKYLKKFVFLRQGVG